VRCRQRHLQCVVNGSLQAALDDECEWMNATDQNTTQQLDTPLFETFTRGSDFVDASTPSHSTTDYSMSPWSQHDIPELSMSQANTPELMYADEYEGDTFARPMGSLYEGTKLGNMYDQLCGDSPFDSVIPSDFISNGVVSLQDAEDMFTRFSELLEQHLWCRAALVHDNLRSVRKSSSLLLAAIITVAALHTRGKEDVFDAAYTELLALVCDSMFDRPHGLDDVRALCIGALWLPDISS
jgi:hypothetical protein